MSCFMCKGFCDDKLTTFLVDVESCIVIVKDVPSQVCAQCGETPYSDSVASQLETIVNSAQKAFSEIMVISYASCAA